MQQSLKSAKDDEYLSQMITFLSLACLTAIVGLLCIYDGFLLFRNKRFKNVALLFFYLFSIITLLCKSGYFINEGFT